MTEEPVLNGSNRIEPDYITSTERIRDQLVERRERRVMLLWGAILISVLATLFAAFLFWA